MRLRIQKLGVLAALVVLMIVAGAANAWAGCPTSPYYSPDFSMNGAGCLTPNGSASLPTPAGNAATITGYAASAGTTTFNASNSFVPGEPVILSNFANSTFLNTLVFPVVTANNSQFTVAYTPPAGSSDTGAATALYLLQLTPNSSAQAGSAWDKTQQLVSASFSTTFAFQINSAGATPGDGFAFVIQNSPMGTAAISADGCALGFAGDPDYNFCGTYTDGITNSVAVAFKTYNDGTDYPNPNSVAIESSRAGANCVDKVGCTLAENDLANGPTLADGNVHAVTVTYTLQPTAAQTNCLGPNGGSPCLDVILDGTDLFPTGVAFDMATIGLTPSNTAWVGFTGATGAANEANNIISWVFTPSGGSTTGNVGSSKPATFNYGGGFQDNNDSTSGYDFTAQLTGQATNPVSAVVTAIPISSQAACTSLVQGNAVFGSGATGAQCFVYQNGGGQGVDLPVVFELTCPPTGECISNTGDFPATLGSDFAFVYTENLPLSMNNFPPDSLSPVTETTGITGLPAVGLLKGQGPDPIHPCTPYPNNTPPLFQSNQISSFVFNPDTSGGAHASSGNTNSCWVVTYQTPSELPTVTITAPAANGNYAVGGSVTATYTCSAVNEGTNSLVGPYLAVNACSGPATFDTSTLGPHTYTATVTDSALNTNYQTVTYNVQQAPQITSASTAYFTVGTNGPQFGVTTTGYPTATVTETGAVPSGITFTPNSDGTATLSGTPAAGTGGTYPITIKASNGVGTAASQSFSLVVDQAPVITSSSSTTFTGGVNGMFTVTTTGNPTPSIGQTGAPSWVTFKDNGNGTATISGTPPLGAGVTSYPITISASNSVSPTASQNFTLNESAGTEMVQFSTSPSGRTFTVDNVVYTGTASLSWAIGSPHTISAGTQTSGGTEYTFNSWSVGGLATQVVTASATTTSYVASFNTLYQLTTAASPSNGGTVLPASGAYYASGAVVPVSATASSGYKFVSWSGPVASASSASTTVKMTAPETVTASFSSGGTLKINPTSVSFNNVYLGTIGAQGVTLTNTGTTPITISNVSIPGSNGGPNQPGNPPDFQLLSLCPQVLQAGKSCVIGLGFYAGSGTLSPYASLVITDSASGSPQSVPLTGTIIDPVASLSSSSISFGSVTHGTTAAGVVTLKNTGLTNLKLSGLSISGTAFKFTAAPATICTSSTTLGAGASCTIGVTFAPTTAKVSYSGLVTITDNALSSTAKISLSGTGK